MQFAPVRDVDVPGEMQKYAQIGATNAQTAERAANVGLIGQQTQGAALTNQVTRARLGAYGGGIPGMASPSGPAIGGNYQSPGGGQPAVTTGGGGQIIGGFAYPPDLVQARELAVLNGQDGAAAAKSIFDQRNQRIGQMVGTLLGPQGQPPSADQWNAMNDRLFQQGYIDNIQHAQVHDHPEMINQVIAGLAPVTDQPGFKYAQGLATGTAGAMTTPHEIMTPGPNGTMVPGVTSNAAILGIAPTAQYGSPLAQRVKTFENASGNPSQTNGSGPGGTATSSAMGDHQWTRGTWADALTQFAPQLAPGMTAAQARNSPQVQALRGNPALSAWMFDQRAPGIAATMAATTPGGQPTNAAVALGHFLGPDGAAQLVKTPSDTSFKTAFPEQAAANPSYAKMTTGQIAQMFARRYGTDAFVPNAGAPVPVGGASPSGQGTGFAPLTPNPAAPGVAPPPPSIQTGPQKLTPSTERLANIDEQVMKEDAAENQANVAASLAANKARLNLLETKQTVAGLPTGSLADQRMSMQAALQQFGTPWAQRLSSTLTGMSEPTLDKMQEAKKQMFNNVVEQEKAVGSGVRIGAMFTNYFQKANPSVDMQNPAIMDILNFQNVAQQMAADYGRASNEHFLAARGATTQALQNNSYTPYQPLTTLNNQWMDPKSVHNPAVYAAAANLMNGMPHDKAFKGLLPEQQVEALNVITRADPNAQATIMARRAAQ